LYLRGEEQKSMQEARCVCSKLEARSFPSACVPQIYIALTIATGQRS
jgi:hypothetical protein